MKPDHISVMTDAELFRRVYGDNTECVSDQLRKSGDINLLRNMPFIINNDPLNELSRLIYMQNPDFEPVIGLKADRLELMISMCIKGVGALITAEGAAKRMLISFFGQIPNNILFFKLKNQAVNYSLAISYKKNKQLSLTELDFINQAKLFFDGE